MTYLRLLFLIPLTFSMLLVDFFLWQLLRRFTASLSVLLRRRLFYIFWSIQLSWILCLWLALIFLAKADIPLWGINKYIMRFTTLFYLSKLLILILWLLMYGGQFLVSFLKRIKQKNVQNAPVYDASRKHFLWRMAGIVGTIPILGISYGNLVSIYDYRVRRVKLSIPTLPKTLEGWRIAQISDLHLGSFLDDKALQKGIDLLLAEKPDMVFFTGDLVNYDTSEVSPFMTQLSRIKAPHGVFSTLGNHDYGEYRAWQQDSDKVKNLQTMKKIHEQLGWKLLDNQHHLFQKENAQLAIIGVGNWGVRGKSSKEGNLRKAYQGTENAAVKLLLSHDPSHWDAQVRKEYKDIVATFSGHTHGLQFGIDIGNFRWGLGKYVFNQWADLYYEEGQYLYVNRGFGFSDILPSRIGVLPEITIFTLSKQNT